MKAFLKILTILIIFAVAIIASFNRNTIDFKFWHEITYDIEVAYLILGVFLTGLIAGFIWVWSFYLKSQEMLKGYKRKLEKNSVNVEYESSKIDILEAKIKVLEKALDSALNKNKEE